ncbi:hypothetical protein HYQ45_005228 [Verticillium longisporum]|uniref:NAD(P)-binding domain-containing protein n=2 Tax=Verticillium longisporum TaxID=100787 RepID=A0A8I3ATM6_VERLO|nr:hypothetical protein HYQ45_005228 [Verticillium longisporum]
MQLSARTLVLAPAKPLPPEHATTTPRPASPPLHSHFSNLTKFDLPPNLTMAIKNVALVGANGTLGSVLLAKLVDSAAFNLTAVIRNGSSSSPPYPTSQVRVVNVDKELTFASLKEALTGQDAVIAAFPLKSPDAHIRLVEAAAAAGVKLFIPADFGSIDADNARARELVPLYRHKLAVRLRAQELADQHPGFTWTGVVCGHFFEWGIKEGFFHTDLKRRTADIFDGGIHRASTTTLTRVGEAVVRILKMYPREEIKNRTLFIQSFCIDQNELVASLQRATDAKWTVNDLESEAFIQEKKAKADGGDVAAVEDLVFAIGTLDADWTQRDDFAMKLLGFEGENLDEVVASVLRDECKGC